MQQEKFPKHLLGETPEEAEAFFKEHSDMLNTIARSLAQKSGLDRADLFGEGIIGLAKAKRDFNPERSDDFKTFAIYKIKDAMNTYIRNNSRPVSIPAYIWKVNRWVSEARILLEGAGMTPSMADSILCGSLLFAERRVIEGRCEEILNFLRKESVRLNVSQEELIRRAENIPISLEINSESESTSDELDERFILSDISDLLSDNERQIFFLKMEGKTLEEIGSIFDKSAPWVLKKIEEIKNKILTM